MRLDKYLSDCGIGTRSEVKKLIKSKQITITFQNAKATNSSVPSPNTQIDENSDIVYLDGKKIDYVKYVYLMLNKPDGVISATDDKQRQVVTDFVPNQYKHLKVFPVGRLDIDTLGLTVLTNDGDLTHKIISPAHHIPKTYIAKVTGKLDDSDICAFKQGMNLGDFTTMPSCLEILQTSPGESLARITIYEGKFHQIKRMFAKVNHQVTYLKRIGINKLFLDDNLKEGDCRELSLNELELLTNGL